MSDSEIKKKISKHFSTVYKHRPYNMHRFTITSINKIDEKEEDVVWRSYTRWHSYHYIYHYEVEAKCERCGAVTRHDVYVECESKECWNPYIYSKLKEWRGEKYISEAGKLVALELSDEEWEKYQDTVLEAIEKLYMDRRWWWKHIGIPLVGKKLIILVITTVYYWLKEKGMHLTKTFLHKKMRDSGLRSYYEWTLNASNYKKYALEIIPYIEEKEMK